MITEKFTAYTEEDPNTLITITPSRVSWDDLTNGESAYVYADKCINFFNGNFVHKFKVMFQNASAAQARAIYWALSNSPTNTQEWRDSSRDAVSLDVYYYDVEYRLYLQLYENGVTTYDSSATLTAGTIYYITITRDDDGGANNAGQYKAYICTGGHYKEGGTLVDTLTKDCAVGEQNDYRYIFACNTRNQTRAETIDGYTEDLDIGEKSFRQRFERRVLDILGSEF